MKTIVNIMLGRGLGGIEQSVIDYSEACALAGFICHAIIDKNALIKPMLQEKNIPFTTLSNRGSWDIGAIWRLKRVLDILEADICIAHGNRALSLLYYAAGKRKIITVTHNYTNKSKKADIVFCPTQALMEHAKAKGIPTSRLHCVPNMVRVPLMPPFYKNHTPLVIGAMGRFREKKGFDVFIDALALLKEKNIAFKALLGGSGEQEEHLKKRAEDKGLKEALAFCGWVTDKKQFFNAIDLFCLPSRHEPFGIVLLEAMAEGLPVIATESEGPSEIIRDNIDGILTAKNDAPAMAGKMEELLQDRDRLQMLANAAFERVKSGYDLPIVSMKLKKILTSLA